MAFVNDVEEFGHDIQFRVGERVRVVIEDIDPKEINIDTGILFKINVSHVHTPKFRRILGTVWMDGKYFKSSITKSGLGEQFTTEICNLRKIEGG